MLQLHRETLGQVSIGPSFLLKADNADVNLSDFSVLETVELRCWGFDCSPEQACRTILAAPRLQRLRWTFPRFPMDRWGFYPYAVSITGQDMKWLQRVIEIVHEHELSLKNIIVVVESIGNDPYSTACLVPLERTAKLKNVSLKFVLQS
jgi:hypothetical protein